MYTEDHDYSQGSDYYYESSTLDYIRVILTSFHLYKDILYNYQLEYVIYIQSLDKVLRFLLWLSSLLTDLMAYTTTANKLSLVNIIDTSFLTHCKVYQPVYSCGALTSVRLPVCSRGVSLPVCLLVSYLCSVYIIGSSVPVLLPEVLKSPALCRHSLTSLENHQIWSLCVVLCCILL